MSASWQLGALLKKNLILMKRGYISTLCEIFFPIILMILLVSLRKTIHIIDYNEPINDEDYLQTNSTLIISSNELLSQKWDGMTFRNPL
jgi:hypothetical protein